MARHDRTHTGGDRRAEGNEFSAFEFCAVARNGGQGEMRIDADVAVAGEMFCRRERAIVFDAANELVHVRRDGCGVFAERANVDDRVVRIVVHVRIGRENPLHAGGPRFERREFAGRVGEFRIARRGNGHGGGKRRAFVEAHAGARFEVRADQQRNLRAALQFVGYYRSRVYLATLDSERPAVGHDDEPADMIFFDLDAGLP